MQQSNHFHGCTTAVDLLRRYKQLAMLNHPARGGSIDRMKQVFQDYQAMLKTDPFRADRMKDDLERFPGLIKELVGLGMDLEMCGSWLWISGNTFEHRDKLKSIGLKFSPNKRMWYFRPDGEESHATKPMDISWIRGKYGSDLVEAETNAKTEAAI